MIFSELVKKSQVVVAENSAAILTATGIVGTVTTAVLSGRGGFKAYALILERELDARSDAESKGDDPDQATLTTKDKVKITWPLFVPAVGAGITTVSAIFFSHRIAATKSAGLAAAYGISEKAFQEYKEKVVEKLGEKKEGDLRDEIAQDRVNANPVTNNNVIMIAGGEVLCYDSLNGRYFTSTMERIKKAENDINKRIIQESYASLAEFYDMIGLDTTEYSNQVGWNLNNFLEIKYSTSMTDDGRPCIVMDFLIEPIARFDKLYD